MEDNRPPASDLDFEKLPEPGDRFKLSTKLGSGVSGKVYEAIDNQTGKGRGEKKIPLTRNALFMTIMQFHNIFFFSQVEKLQLRFLI